MCVYFPLDIQRYPVLHPAKQHCDGDIAYFDPFAGPGACHTFGQNFDRRYGTVTAEYLINERNNGVGTRCTLIHHCLRNNRRDIEFYIDLIPLVTKSTKQL